MVPGVFSLLPVANIGRDASILRSIAEPNAYLALWHRSMPAHVAAWIESWKKSTDPALDTVVSVEDSKLAVARALIDAGRPRGHRNAVAVSGCPAIGRYLFQTGRLRPGADSA